MMNGNRTDSGKRYRCVLNGQKGGPAIPKNIFQTIIDRYSPHGIRADRARLPKVVYHYTNAAGLNGILESDKVWATEYRFLNDRSEVQYTRGIVQSILTKRMQASPADDLSKLYSSILSRLDRPADDTEIYVFSLSEDGDSLSQWRGYGQDARGFAIGFDLTSLLNATEADDGSVSCTRVEYDLEYQQDGLCSALRDIERTYEAELKKHGADPATVLSKAATAFDIIGWNRSMINKHASFASEREWRLFSFFEDDARLTCKVRGRGTGFLPYAEFDSVDLGGEGGKLPIVEIGIGPGFGDHDQKLAVEVLCRQHGYKPKIYRANAPYRSL